MLKRNILILILGTVLLPNFAFTPDSASALQMPQNGSELAEMAGISAEAYIVQDMKTGQVLIQKNAGLNWTPASLTKLVTALVVLDSKVKPDKVVTMTLQDQISGGCNIGGACIKAKPGVKFTVDGLFHATLLPSANNAAFALARSTGLTTEQFTARMNKKVAALGAIHSHFNEPTGMDPSNSITAADYAKIVTAAFSNPYLRKIAQLNLYTLHSLNNNRYTQTIKNTDKLLSDGTVNILGAKTGYLNEANYNFASLLKYRNGPELSVVVLGESHMYSAFSETVKLASLAQEAKDLLLSNSLILDH